ncbi:hypothetical protein HanHA300_Chr17g0652121 [Helianthus annuus]|nr:hypothetical protein HanHA300_Chr17g0652121 [Helianthus annuus]KAJ0433226.1 hypothetical protein HanIR_Chr17g0867871 [Helianthus annuus]
MITYIFIKSISKPTEFIALNLIAIQLLQSSTHLNPYLIWVFCVMGACVSVHHKASAMKVQVSFDSANKPDRKPVIHSTDGHVAVKPQLPPSQSVPAFSEYGCPVCTRFAMIYFVWLMIRV